MKQCTTLLCAFAISITMANAEILKKVQFGELYYNLDTESLTAEVASPVNNKLTEYVIPASVKYESTPYDVTSIGSNAFHRCDSLSTMSIPDNIISISESAFSWCWQLETITIPVSVTSIGNDAFQGCISLLTIDVASGNPAYCSIDGILFSKDKTTLIRYPGGKEGAYTIPDYVTDIQAGAFSTSIQLTSITIPNSITHIREHTFYQCDTLASVVLPNNLESIDDWAFGGCTELRNIVIPESVTAIRRQAFSYCHKLASIYIPSAVTFLGTDEGDANGTAFTSCMGMTSINVSSENPNYCSIDGVLFSKDRKTLFQFPCGRKGTYTIPYGTNTISSYALHNCDSLKAVIIPSTVTRVEPMSMGFCDTLSSVTCYAATPPATGWIKDLGNDIFAYSSLVKLYVPQQSVEAYTNAASWNSATAILPISANNVEVSEITLSPGTTSVDIVWPQITGAESYELVILDDNGNIVCTLVFDADGKLRTISMHALSKNGNSQTAQENGFSFTVSGLSSATTYSYTLTAKDSDDNILNTENGSFTTQVATGIDGIENHIHSTKIIRNGQILIIKGNKTYTLQGQEIE